VPEDRIRPILRTCASGLAALHARGILHQDFHINNIFLSGQSAVIGDLGNAHDLPGEDHPPPQLPDWSVALARCVTVL
jgi:serine/threonine protein kinase